MKTEFLVHNYAMADIIPAFNEMTPERKQIIEENPAFTSQPFSFLMKNVYGQAVINYTSIWQEKLTAYALSVYKIKSAKSDSEKHYVASFFVSDFFKAQENKSDGGALYSEVYDAVANLVDVKIVLPKQQGETKGRKKVYGGTNIYTDSYIDPETGIAYLVFNNRLIKALEESKNGQTEIKIKELAKISSNTAMVLGRYILSFRGFAGKNGNPPLIWTVKIYFDDFKEKLGYSKDSYIYKCTNAKFYDGYIKPALKQMKNLKNFVIIEEKPIFLKNKKLGIELVCKKVDYYDLEEENEISIFSQAVSALKECHIDSVDEKIKMLANNKSEFIYFVGTENQLIFKNNLVILENQQVIESRWEHFKLICREAMNDTLIAYERKQKNQNSIVS